jgi:starch synthase
VEYFGGVGFLKAGLASATALTTVSPTYAEEIRTPAHGMALEGLLSTRAADLHGIVNGIDVDVWNPESDPHLAASFSARDPSGRAANRAAVEARFRLDADDGPLFCFVSRLTGQKGADLLVEAASSSWRPAGGSPCSGRGDAAIEAALLRLAGLHPGRIGTVIGYDEALGAPDAGRLRRDPDPRRASNPAG